MSIHPSSEVLEMLPVEVAGAKPLTSFKVGHDPFMSGVR